MLLRSADGSVAVHHDRHVEGLFPRQTWLELLAATGFVTTWLVDAEERVVFVGRRPMSGA
jgi:hypothetical protein